MKKLLNILGAMVLVGTASTNIIACNGNNNKPTTQKINLSDLKNTSTIILQNTTISVITYKSKLINELKKQSEFNKLKIDDVDITKTDDSILQDSDIKQGMLDTKINAKQTSINFIGKKT